MSIFSKIGNFFKNLLSQAFNAAKESGLTNELLQSALALVRVAATRFTDNSQKREYVVQALVSKGVPESIARLAVELAYRLFKKEIEKLPTGA